MCTQGYPKSYVTFLRTNQLNTANLLKKPDICKFFRSQNEFYPNFVL